MNFKSTNSKIVFSIIIGLIIGFLIKLKFLDSLIVIGETNMLTGLSSPIVWITFILCILITYLIYSLFQKKE